MQLETDVSVKLDQQRCNQAKCHKTNITTGRWIPCQQNHKL